MAEALGIASGIAGLISLTIEVFGISYKYVNGVRDASSSVRKFLNELEALQTVLRHVERITGEKNGLEVSDDAGSCLLSIRESSEYIELLQKVRYKLQQRQQSSSLRNKMKALTWPFSEKETVALTESLHRHLEIYNLALTVDNRTIGERTFGEVRKINISQQDSRNQAILDWLSPLKMYQKQQDTISKRRGITGSWLLENTVFQSWTDDESSNRTLWCPGDPGSGKTVITSVVIAYLLNNHANEDTKVVYFYCNYKDQAAQTAPNLIACLVRQIIGSPKELPQELTVLYEELHRQRCPSFDEVKRLFMAMCTRYKQTYILVDALDECEASHERRLLLPVLEALPYTRTRLFVTSRPNNEDITRTFGKADQIIIAAPTSDLREYILERMNERRDFLDRLTPELKEKITASISARASGMFLHTALQMNRIFDTRTVKGIKSALTSMSGELDELYREALDRIQKQAGDDGDLGMRVLSWITHAKRPLSVDELRYGLAIEYSEVQEDLEDFDEDNLLSPGSLVDVCAGLVIIDSNSNVVRLVHYTTQEFFNKARLDLFEGSEIDISRACLRCLSYDHDIKSHYGELRINLFHSNPFLKYACQHWSSHVKSELLTEIPNPKFVKAVADFKSSDAIRFGVLLLYGLILFLYISEEKCETFLELAAGLGLEDLVAVLLDTRTRPFPVSDISVTFASYKGNLNVVRQLIQNGGAVDSAFPNAFSSGTISPLESACVRGHLAVAEFLIEHGADIYGRSSAEHPPIHAAAISENTDLINLLLKKGVNANARNQAGWTACHQAGSRDLTETVRFLIDAGCDLELKDDNGRTVLLTCCHSNFDMIKLLLDRGADACAKDKKGKTLRHKLEENLQQPHYKLEAGDPHDTMRAIELLRKAEQKSSTAPTNDPQVNKPNSSAQLVSLA